jgi:hydrogenase maturation protease
MKKILIGGIGNVLLGDDGVGPKIVRMLEARYRFASDVDVEDLGTPGLELVDYLLGRETVVLVDAVKCDEAPGTILLYCKPEILQARVPDRTGTHAASLVDTLLTLEMIGAAPAHVLLVGVVGQSHAIGCSLSEPVQNSIEAAIETIVCELAHLHICIAPGPSCPTPDIWWERKSQSDSPSSCVFG